MVWKSGPQPCEQLLFLLWSKLNALIWQEFRNPNKSADPTKLQHVSRSMKVNGLLCCHRSAHTFKAKHASKLPKGNYSQSSLSLMLIPYFWNNTLLSAWWEGLMQMSPSLPHALLRLLEPFGSGAPHCQVRTVSTDKEALDAVRLTSKGCSALFWFLSPYGGQHEGLIFIWTFGGTLSALSGLCMNTEFSRTSSVPWNWKNSAACWERWLE